MSEREEVLLTALDEAVEAREGTYFQLDYPTERDHAIKQYAEAREAIRRALTPAQRVVVTEAMRQRAQAAYRRAWCKEAAGQDMGPLSAEKMDRVWDAALTEARDAASMPLATEAEERAVSIRLMEESAEDWQEEIEYLYPPVPPDGVTTFHSPLALARYAAEALEKKWEADNANAFCEAVRGADAGGEG
jgi:hypothetical protein